VNHYIHTDTWRFREFIYDVQGEIRHCDWMRKLACFAWARSNFSGYGIV